ncbi:glycoside hydrolase family 26 protein [Planobispora siamensis]|uniref:glycoside hydrolase family 26 protein n=1 Tax=Planobispora siamensis TaxID=936338 RepID=UPI0035A222E1
MKFRKAYVCGALAALAASAVVWSLPSMIAGTDSEPGDRPAEDSHDPGETRFGVFLASDERGVERLSAFESWLGVKTTVGRTYLPGENWLALQGPDFILEPWMRWRAAEPDRILALNVPMVAPNEVEMPDGTVAALLNAGAMGAFDHGFRRLASRLVAGGAADTIIVLGWEMNGTTYSSRCAPDPEAWKGYWRRIVTAMRSVEGQRLRFDFAPSRGRDAIPWTECYPGDDVVDIIGMDTYDQPGGETFADYVRQPYGMAFHAEFARARGKPISFPEWGLFRRGDRPGYMRRMLEWISTHDVVYHSISDYCPHGVWQCPSNPRSSRVFRKRLPAMVSPEGSPAPSSGDGSPVPSSADSGTPPVTGDSVPPESPAPVTGEDSPVPPSGGSEAPSPEESREKSPEKPREKSPEESREESAEKPPAPDEPPRPKTDPAAPPHPTPGPGVPPIPAAREVSAARRSSASRRPKPAALADPASPSRRASSG